MRDNPVLTEVRFDSANSINKFGKYFFFSLEQKFQLVWCVNLVRCVLMYGVDKLGCHIVEPE